MRLKDKILELVEKHHNEVVHFREWLHQHPETAFQEFETAEFIASFLDKQGIEYTKGVAKTGLVGLIKGHLEGDAVVAIRADMDALEINESNKVPYKSLNPGMMHACGHDVHMASLMGSIMVLNQLKDSFGGTIKLIFQPSEEKNPGGASVMIREGVLHNPDVQSIFAQHVYPDLEAGKVGFREGNYMASTDEIYLTVKGKGGHGGIPNKLVDTVLVASHIIVALQQIVSRNSNPLIPSVLSFGKFVADGQTNVIPNVVNIAGTMRTFDESWRKEMHVRIETLSKGIAQAMGADCEVIISKGYPVVKNDIAMTNRFKSAAIELLGAENVVDLSMRMTGEDFGFFSQKIPSCFYRLGTAGESEESKNNLHTPFFDIDTKSLKTAVALMSWLAVNELNELN
jgi:amidohydrolase